MMSILIATQMMSQKTTNNMFILYLSFCLLNFTFFLVKYAMTHMMFF